MSNYLKMFLLLTTLATLFVQCADAELFLHLDGSVTEGEPREVAFKDKAKGNHVLPLNPLEGYDHDRGVGTALGVYQASFGAVGDTAMHYGSSEWRAGVITDPNHPDFSRTYDKLTISFWFKPNSEPDNDGFSNYLMGKMGGDGNRGWQLSQNDDSGKLSLVFFSGPSGYQQTAGINNADVNPAEFTHITITFEAEVALKAYKNGVKITDTVAISGFNGYNTSYFQVANRGDNMKRSADGILDDLGMWDEVVSHQRIAAIYAMGHFEDRDLQDPAIDELLNAFNTQNSVNIGCNVWEYTTGLGSSTGQTGGSLAQCNAYVVLDDSGNGMKLVSCNEPVVGDIDNDCHVGLTDLDTVVSDWLSSNFELDKSLMQNDLPEDVMIMDEYHINTGTQQFGDITGDGKMDIISVSSDWSLYAYDNAGNELWNYQAPPEGADKRAGHEAPGTIWDFDQDGYAEVVHWRMINGVDSLVISDGQTGTVLKSVDWPVPFADHNYRNFKTAIAKLGSGYADDLIVLSDGGYSGDGRTPQEIQQTHPVTHTITAYDSDLNQLWQQQECRARDHLGHYPYPKDIDNDGLDEVVLSHYVLDTDGSVIWDNFDQFPDNRDHVDSLRFTELNNDGEMDIVCATSDAGALAVEALTGNILWQSAAGHAQQIEAGDFIGGSDTDVVVNVRSWGDDPMHDLYAQMQWFDSSGNFVKAWPSEPLYANPDFVKGDWQGDGSEQLFWHKFIVESDGTGSQYFYEGAVRMFDINGDGVDEVIGRVNRQGGRCLLRVYGSKSASRSLTPVQHTEDYLRNVVANFTHY